MARWFLAVLAAAAAAALLRDRAWVPGMAAAAAAVYFGLRASGRIGPRGGTRP